MLEIRSLSAWYGEAQALRDVDLTVAPGEVVTLLGRNGAGKTTLLRSIIGIHRQVSGAVVLEGTDLSTTPAHRRARQGLGWVQDDRGIFSDLSVEENILIVPQGGDDAWSLGTVYEQFPALQARRREHGSSLSGGEQQMLALARMLRAGSSYLLLDEPTEGLAPVIVQQIGQVIAAARDRGIGVLLVEQNVQFASRLATRHYVLAQGRVVDELDHHEFANRRGAVLEHLGL